MSASKITIRPATPDDAEALLSIYAPYVEQTAITFEYEVPSVEEFRDRIVHTLKLYPYLVAQRETSTNSDASTENVGYAYAGPLHARAAYAWSVETSIYVKKKRKKIRDRQGTLLRFGESPCRPEHYECKCLHCQPGNRR